MMKEMVSFLKNGDLDDDGVMSFIEFKSIISKLQREVTTSSSAAGLTGPDLDVLYAMLDPMQCGYVLFEDFFRAVLGPMNIDRMKLVQCAYEKLDADNDGCIDATELIAFYKKHGGPKSSGAKFDEQKMYEIINSFGIASTGKLTKEEFFNYYRNMSFFTDSDIIFENEICATWCITFSELVSAVKKTKKSASTLRKSKEMEPGFYQHADDAAVKKLYDLFFRGGVNEGLKELLTLVTKSQTVDGIISQTEFKTLLKKKGRLDKVADDDKLTGPEMDKLYFMLDPSKSGNVHFQEFYEAMRVLSDPSLAQNSRTNSTRGVSVADVASPTKLIAKTDSHSSTPLKPISESPSARGSSVFKDPSRGGKVKKALLARLKAEGAEDAEGTATDSQSAATPPTPASSTASGAKASDTHPAAPEKKTTESKVKLFADPTRGKQIRQALLNQLKKGGSESVMITTDAPPPTQSQPASKSSATSASTLVVEGDGAATSSERELIAALKKTIESQERTIASQLQTITLLQKLVEKNG